MFSRTSSSEAPLAKSLCTYLIPSLQGHIPRALLSLPALLQISSPILVCPVSASIQRSCPATINGSGDHSNTAGMQGGLLMPQNCLPSLNKARPPFAVCIKNGIPSDPWRGLDTFLCTAHGKIRVFSAALRGFWRLLWCMISQHQRSSRQRRQKWQNLWFQFSRILSR